MPHKSISISTDAIVRIIVILLLIGFLYLIKDVLALLFIAVILSSAFGPFIDWLQEKKIPRGVGIIGVYLIFFFVVGGAIYLLIDPITLQIKDLARAFPDFYDKISSGLQYLQKVDSQEAAKTLSTSLSDLTKSLSQASSSIYNLVTSIFGGVVSFFVLLVITFYLTVEKNSLKNFVQSIVPFHHQKYAADLITKIQHRMGFWLRGQLILSFIIFLLIYLGLSLLGIKYALILALLAGIFEIVPFLGPLIAAIPGIFFAFAQSPAKAIAVIVLYIVVQQIENNFIVPKVMGKSTGLNPLVVILSILIGMRIAGVVGALVAVPIAAAAAVYVETLHNKSKATK